MKNLSMEQQIKRTEESVKKLQENYDEMIALQKKHTGNYYDDYYSTSTYSELIFLQKQLLDNASAFLKELRESQVMKTSEKEH
jgi:hypothetical protein